jgi:hypothetical protein
MDTLKINKKHLEEIKGAKILLENPGLGIKISNYVGKPIELGLDKLSAKYREPIDKAVQNSLDKGLQYLTYSFNEKIRLNPITYKIAVGTTGFAGGIVGLWGLPVELPFTTMIMLRAILETAMNNGEKIEDVTTRMACLEVFALGGKSSKDDAAESSYFAVRIALAKAIREATKYVAGKGLTEKGAPVIIKLITSIAARYGIVVSEKFVAQSIPILGGLTGATINTIFMDHFQKMAEGHFTIRRLERIYNPAIVQEVYNSISI